MIHALALESFDHIEALAPEEDGAYQDGYDQGLADAQKSHETDQARLTTELVQSISDLEFKYIEARSEITASLAPMLSAFTAKILPLCVAHGFTMQITDVLHEVAAHSLDSPLEIAVHPSQIEAVTWAVGQGGPETTISADAQLTPHGAWITHGRVEQHIDMDAVAQKIEMILSAIGQPDERNENNG
jgi:flagellar biosynthesis/type III secretory pathway protein FliH